MSPWVLVIYIYAGMMAKGDSVTIHSVPMPSESVCRREGSRGSELVTGSAKTYRYVCLDLRENAR